MNWRRWWPFNRRRGDRRIHWTGFYGKGAQRRTGLDDRREWKL